MDKDMKTLICEIILMFIIIIVTIPICVNASHNYNNKKDNMQKYTNMSVNIEYKSKKMLVNIDNYNDDKRVVNLILKTSKFSNEYMVNIDGVEYNLNEIVYTEDDNNYYFNLGSYEINKRRAVEFSMNLVGEDIYDDSITYSFMVEVANC